jgi:glycosyltransferase involved in cell wall biosynthesis
MKIAVGVPSYREADNISFVTTQVDKGLCLLRDKLPIFNNAAIFNIDNESDYGTTQVFEATQTVFPKYSIKSHGTPGKGKNVLAFFREVSKSDYDIVLTFDSDLKSIEPDWILKFISPFIDDDCDFVAPIYERSRFEGSTTNHFAYPLIYAFFGKDIRQPIAGDFAMSIDFVRHVLSCQTPKEAERYGIDIFLTIQANLFSGLIKQIKLGQKIHKPSFSKLEAMFPQVAASALEALRQENIAPIDFSAKQSMEICISDRKDFPHVLLANELLVRQRQKLRKNISNIFWLDNDRESVLNYLNSDNIYFTKDIWADVFSKWLLFSLVHSEQDSFELANQLLPLFVFRAVSFWNKVANDVPLKVEDEIRSQARLIRERVASGASRFKKLE